MKCNGAGKLKWYIEMIVTFDTLFNDYFKKSEDIPDKDLRACRTVKIFSEDFPRVKIQMRMRTINFYFECF